MLRAYLQDIAELDQGYGRKQQAVARRLLWDGIHRLISERVIQRRTDAPEPAGADPEEQNNRSTEDEGAAEGAS